MHKSCRKTVDTYWGPVWMLVIVNVIVDKSFSSDREAYRLGKKEKPPFLESEKSDPVEEEKNIPGELLCSLCKDILRDAVVIQCCGNSFCDECKPANNDLFAQ